MKTIPAAVLSAAAAFGAATWVYHADDPAPPLTFDPSLPADARLAALEQAVSDERMARQLLQEEVLVLTNELEQLRRGPDGDRSGQSAAGQSSVEVRAAEFEERRQRFERRNSTEGRIDRLVDAGFAPGRAAWIVQREEELQMEELTARYEAGVSGERDDFFRERLQTSNALREELGDADYERYLDANNRPTSVSVSSVIGSSPAHSAGLQPGDEILRYDGQRVFGMTDINLASMAGTAGENIVLDIVRDGVPMQIVIPRGPLGITGGRRR